MVQNVEALGPTSAPGARIICALDVPDIDEAARLVYLLQADVGVFKVGLQLLNAAGRQAFGILRNAGARRILYDAKLHDIPNTIAGAVRAIVDLDLWGVTVHAVAGAAGLTAAVAALRGDSQRASPPYIFGVTALTSITPHILRHELEVPIPMTEYVQRLARLAADSGCSGVIASPMEIAAVRSAVDERDFLVVTPGVRPAGAAADDQARFTSPAEAIRLGADYLVIGRPITAGSDPRSAARGIAEEVAGALAKR